MTAQERERRGCVDKFQVRDAAGHDVHFDAATEFAHLVRDPGSQVGGAEGGYVLIRFDGDGSSYSVVHVEAPAGWWPTEGTAPADLVYRGAECLRLLHSKLEAFEALLDEGGAIDIAVSKTS